MSAGDHNIGNCPQCKSDNRHVSIETFEPGSNVLNHFFVQCSVCGLAGGLGTTQREATILWNRMI